MKTSATTTKHVTETVKRRNLLSSLSSVLDPNKLGRVGRWLLLCVPLMLGYIAWAACYAPVVWELGFEHVSGGAALFAAVHIVAFALISIVCGTVFIFNIIPRLIRWANDGE